MERFASVKQEAAHRGLRQGKREPPSSRMTLDGRTMLWPRREKQSEIQRLESTTQLVCTGSGANERCRGGTLFFGWRGRENRARSARRNPRMALRCMLLTPSGLAPFVRLEALWHYTGSRRSVTEPLENLCAVRPSSSLLLKSARCRPLFLAVCSLSAELWIFCRNGWRQ
jgi:hypothetical protein